MSAVAEQTETSKRNAIGQCLLEAVAQLETVIDELNLLDSPHNDDLVNHVFEARDNLDALTDAIHGGSYADYFEPQPWHVLPFKIIPKPRRKNAKIKPGECPECGAPYGLAFVCGNGHHVPSRGRYKYRRVVRRRKA